MSCFDLYSAKVASKPSYIGGPGNVRNLFEASHVAGEGAEGNSAFSNSNPEKFKHAKIDFSSSCIVHVQAVCSSTSN